MALPTLTLHPTWMEESSRLESIASVVGGLTFGALEIGSDLHSWTWIGIALLIPIGFCLVRLLAADPRSD